MKSLRVAGLLVAFVLGALGPEAQARTPPDSFADLAEKLMPAVVNISTSQFMQAPPEMPNLEDLPEGSPFREFFEEFFNQQRGGQGEQPRERVTSLGSGFIIDKSGYVVTNNHVIADADEITVILNDDTQLKAEIVGRDSRTDLALLKVDAGFDLPSVAFGDSDKVRVGDWVLAVGNPFGFGNTVTAGIISARQRDINAGPYDNFLQTDAPINRGNSGGPLFDLDGKVIGINTAIFSPSGGSIGIGFATPANMAKMVIDQLREFGRAKRGWLGVRVQSVDPDIAEAFGLKEASGALVASVTEAGPAAKAGIQPGDVILTFDGKPVPNMRVLPRVVAETSVGREVDVEIVRKGKHQTVRVVLGELPEEDELAALEGGSGGLEEPEAEKAISKLGMTMATITPDLRERYQIGEDVTGVLVTGVEPGSPAAEAGIAEGDVLVEVAQNQVADPSDVAEAVDGAEKAEAHKIVVLLDRQGDRRFVALDTGKAAN